MCLLKDGCNQGINPVRLTSLNSIQCVLVRTNVVIKKYIYTCKTIESHLVSLDFVRTMENGCSNLLKCANKHGNTVLLNIVFRPDTCPVSLDVSSIHHTQCRDIPRAQLIAL